MPYIYQAELFCDDCGKAICKDRKAQLLAKGLTAEQFAKAYEDERNYDSDEYPKYVANIGESDSPNHCGSGEECLNAVVLTDGVKVGELLSTELTEVGADYVREVVSNGGPVAEFWAEQFSDYL